MNTIKKLTLIIAMILLSGSGLLFGCDTLYSNMTLELNKDEITLYLDSSDSDETEEPEEEDTDSIFIATISKLPKFVSNNIIINQTNLGVVTVDQIDKNDETNEITLKVNPLKAGSTKIIVKTEEGNKEAYITVNVIEPISDLQTNLNYKPVFVVGEPKSINTTEALNFIPASTNQKDVVYSLVTETENVTVSPAGLITATESADNVTIRATSVSDDSIFADVLIKVINPILEEDIKLQLNGQDVTQVMLATNKLEESQATYNITVENTVEAYNVILNVENIFIVESEKTGAQSFLLRSIGLGTTTITAKVEIIGYESYFVEKAFNVVVIEYPTTVTINGSSAVLNNVEIFDNYINGLGQPFTLNVGTIGAYDKRIMLEVSAEDRVKLEMRYSDGSLIDIDNDILPGGIEIYVRALPDETDGSVSGTASIKAIAYASIALGQEVSNTLNVVLSKGADDIEVVPSSLRIESGQFATLNINAKPQDSSLGKVSLEVVNYNVIEYESINGSDTEYKIYAKETGNAKIIITSMNGIKKEVEVVVYKVLTDFSLNLYTIEQEPDIGQINKTTTEFGNETLLDATIAIGSGMPLLVNKYPTDASYVETTYISSNPSVATISSSGFISASSVGTTTITVAITKHIDPSNGQPVIEQRSFTLNTYVPIRSVELNYYQFELLDSQNLGFYDIERSKLALELNINPMQATFNTESIEWTSSNSYASVDENGLVMAAIPAEIDKVSATITATIKEFDRYYTQKCVVVIKRAVRVSDISILNLDSDHLYFDARLGLGEENETANSYKLETQLYPNDANNQNVIYQYVQGEGDSNTEPVVIVKEDGTIIPNRAGNAQVYVIAEDSYTATDTYTKYEVINVRVADGQTEETAIEISSPSDLFDINTQEGLSLNYVVTETIDLTGYTIEPIGIVEGQLIGFSGSLSGKYSYFEETVNNQIIGINFDIGTTARTNYVGLFGLVNGGTIKDLNIKVSNMEVQLLSNSVNTMSYIGGLVAKNELGTVNNVNIEITSSYIELANRINYVGGIVGHNTGNIQNTKTAGNLNVTEKIGIVTTPQFSVGGFVGHNSGIIEAGFNVLDNTLIESFSNINARLNVNIAQAASTLNGFGAIAGNNYGTVQNITSNANIAGFDNVGGIVGINNGTISNVLASGFVSGINNVGGLVGQGNGLINNAIVLALDKFELSEVVTPLIKGVNNVGGLVGYSLNSNISYSYIKSFYTRTIDSILYFGDIVIDIPQAYIQDINAGGLVGFADAALITKCYSDVNVKINDEFTTNVNVYAGGILGSNSNVIKIEKNYAKGSVAASGNSQVSGVIAKLDLSQAGTYLLVKNYSMVNLEGTVKGGIVSSVNGTTGLGVYSGSLYLDSMAADNSYGVPKTIGELTTQSIYQAEGYDFSSTGTWGMNVDYNDNTPYIKYDSANKMLIQAPNTLTVTVNDGIENLDPQTVNENSLKNNHFKIDDKKAVVYYYENNDGQLNTYSIDNISGQYGQPIITKGFLPDSVNIEWVQSSSNNDAVLRIIDGGLFEVLKEGLATIRISSILDKNVYDEFEIAVIKPVINFNLNKQDTQSGDFKKLETSSDLLVINKNNIERIYPAIDAFIDNKQYVSNTNAYINYFTNSLPIGDFKGYTWGFDGSEYNVNIDIDEAHVIDALNSGQNVITLLPKVDVNFDSGLETLSLDFLQKEFTLSIMEGSTNLDLSSYEASISLKDIFVLDVELTTDITNTSVIDVESIERIGSQVTDIPEDEIKITSVSKMIIGNVIYQRFEIEIVDKYDELYKEEQIYKIKFASYDESQAGQPAVGAPPIIEKEFILNIIPQDIFRIDMNYYSASEIFENEGVTYYNPNEMPSNSIVTGKVGILKMGIYPEFSNLDYLDLKYYTNGNFELSLDQIAFEGDGYSAVYPQSELIEDGIRLRLISNFENPNYSYDGNIYVKALIASGVTINTEFTLVATAYKILTDGSLVAGLSSSITLIAQPASKVDISYNGMQESEIAIGTKQQITVSTTKMDDAFNLTWNNQNDESVSVQLIDTYDIGFTTYNVYEIELDSSYYIGDGATKSFKDLVKLQVIAERTINNNVEQFKSNELTLIPALYTINSITVNDVVEDYFTMPFGGVYPLTISVNANYEDKEEGNQPIESQIEAFETTLSNDIRTWYSREHKADGNNQDTLLELNNNYGNYQFVQNIEVYIQPTRVSSNDLFAAKVQFKYDWEDAAYVGIPTVNLDDLGQFQAGIGEDNYITIDFEFKTDFYLRTDEDNPIPIYDEEGLLGMQEGASYILMNDITLGSSSPFDPINVAIKSLDGNDKTITILEFKDSSDSTDSEEILAEANLGLFGVIGQNTILKNINIDLTNLVIDASNYLRVNIGGVVANNNGGIVYNCYTYSNKGVAEQGIDLIVSQSLNSQNVSVYVGGIAAKNAGYITNSRSTLEIKADQGYIAGISASNSGVIASSYYKDGYIKNASQTKATSAIAGLVVTNEATGQIRYSYVEGISNIEGVDQIEDNRIIGGGLIFSGDIGGFVYENKGLITDSYSNIKVVSQSRSAGFVFNNLGTIKNAYSLSKVAYNVAAHTPFTGTDEKGVVLNSSQDQIVNCYYLTGQFAGMAKEPATSISLAEWNLQTTYAGYSFSSNTDESYGVWQIIGAELGPYLTSANQIAQSRKQLTKEIIDEETGATEYIYTSEAGFTEGSYVNPYIVYDSKQFNTLFTEGDQSFIEHVRVVKDFSFGSSEIAKTYNTDFAGVLDGNGMQIGNINVVASNDSDINQIGLFRSLTTINGNSGIIKNIDFLINQVFANDTTCVGAIAGVINNANMYNVNIEGADTVVQGRNLVGGIAGKIIGSTDIVNVAVDISINSSFRENIEQLVAYDIYSGGNDAFVSYAGAIAGVIDTVSGTIENVKITGNSRVIGETVGTAFGLVGKTTIVNQITVYVQQNQFIRATKAAGGLVGENRGQITSSVVQNIESVQQVMDQNIADNNFGKVANGQNINFFAGISQVAGGLVGLNNGGTIDNSESKIDVRNNNVLVAGGLVGRTVGGSITNSVAYGSVLSSQAVGGLIGAVTMDTVLAKQDANFNEVGLIKFAHIALGNLSSQAKVTLDNVKAYNNWININEDEDYYALVGQGIETAANETPVGLVVGGLVGLVQYEPNYADISNYSDLFNISDKANNEYINSIYDPLSYTESDGYALISEYGFDLQSLAVIFDDSNKPFEVINGYDYSTENANNILGQGIEVFALYS